MPCVGRGRGHLGGVQGVLLFEASFEVIVAPLKAAKCIVETAVAGLGLC